MNCAARLLCAALGGFIAAGTVAPDVRAQSLQPGIVLAQAERPGIFRFLFKNRRKREAAPQQRIQILPTLREAPRQEPKAKARKQRQAEKPRKKRSKRPAVAAAPREIQAVEKAADAKRVLVIGDFMAGALAKGLAESFAENPNIVVIDAIKGDSGLVRADYYDWAAQLPTIVQEQKPDAILALLGANDRQAIATEAGSQSVGTDGWRAAYSARVSALADVLKASTKPVLWAGLAPVKPSAMSRDYSTFNGIVREQLEGKGMRYVDVWNGFADEEGKYVTTGPDVNGQSVQLRDSDGLNFTRAGQRKLAFFVERELTELLGGAAPLLAATGSTEPAIFEPADQGPRIGPMIPIDALSVAVATSLSAGAPPVATGPAAQSGHGKVAERVAERLVGDGKTVPPPGRADNFAWPAPPVPVATPAVAQAPTSAPNAAPSLQPPGAAPDPAPVPVAAP
jgi:hypothetical protein